MEEYILSQALKLEAQFLRGIFKRRWHQITRSIWHDSEADARKYQQIFGFNIRGVQRKLFSTGKTSEWDVSLLGLALRPLKDTSIHGLKEDFAVNEVVKVRNKVAHAAGAIPKNDFEEMWRVLEDSLVTFGIDVCALHKLRMPAALNDATTSTLTTTPTTLHPKNLVPNQISNYAISTTKNCTPISNVPTNASDKVLHPKNLEPNLSNSTVSPSVTKMLLIKENGNKFLRQARLDEAIECYSEALKISDLTAIQKAELLTNKSLVYIQKAHKSNTPKERNRLFRQAKADAKAAQILAPTWSRPHYRYARIQHINEKYKKAIENYDIVLALEPSYDKARHFRAICVEELAKLLALTNEQMTNNDQITNKDQMTDNDATIPFKEPSSISTKKRKTSEMSANDNFPIITKAESIQFGANYSELNCQKEIKIDELNREIIPDTVNPTQIENKTPNNNLDSQMIIYKPQKHINEEIIPRTNKNKYHDLRRIEIITQDRENTYQIRESQKRQKREVQTSSKPLKISTPFVDNCLANFTPLAISEMDVDFDHVYEGFILKCTVLGPFSVLVGAYTLVEDSHGTVARLGLYNFGFKSDAEFMVVFWIGQQISIKNPYWRIGMDGRPFIRVDDPETVVIGAEKRKNVCSVCLGEGKKQCGECSVFYCSKKCQEIDWYIYKHSYICS